MAYIRIPFSPLWEVLLLMPTFYPVMLTLTLTLTSLHSDSNESTLRMSRVRRAGD